MNSNEQTDLFDVDRLPEKQPFVHGASNVSGQVEWYTPKEYIDSARKVMGTIDCDPCTSELAQTVINATVHYTIKDDGLVHPWHGNVWLNPPYSAKIITKFVDKLLAHLGDGSVKQCIMLTHNNAETAWFQKASKWAQSWLWTRGRVRFYNVHGKGTSPTHGHTFMYFGKRIKRFDREFAQYGLLLGRKEK